ncbi:MAG: hypothetical protein IPL65_19815 [Lewinellaceae bacterium]|nr:hypothetical protein [Lewinellaceae bacterium]
MSMVSGAPKLELQYAVHIPGLGILSSQKAGDFVGTTDGRKRIIGFMASLQGPDAVKYDLVYHAKFKGIDSPVSGQNGSWCGTQKKSGQTLESVQIEIRKRD